MTLSFRSNKLKRPTFLLILLLLSACTPTMAGNSLSDVETSVSTIPPETTQHPTNPPTLVSTQTFTPQASPTLDLTQTQAESERQASLLLAEGMDSALKTSSSEWHIQVQTLDGEVYFSHHADSSLFIDKLINLPLAMLFLHAIESTGVTEIKKYLAAHGDYTTTYRQTLYESTVYGSSIATASLLATIPDYGLNLTQTFATWQAPATNLQHGLSTAGDLSRLLAGLYSRSLLSEESTFLILNMLDQGILTGNSLRDLVPNGATYHEKHIVISGEGSMLGELAIIDTSQNVYLVVILGLGNDPSPESYTDLLQTYEQLCMVFWDYARER